LASTTPALQMAGHQGPVRQARFSEDGRRVVTAGADGTARIWDAGTGKEIVPPLWHGGPVSTAAWGHGDRLVMTTREGKLARAWDAGTGAELTTIRFVNPAGVRHAAVTPDGRHAVLSSYGWISVFDRASKRQLVRMRHGNTISSPPQISPDGGRLLTTSVARS